MMFARIWITKGTIMTIKLWRWIKKKVTRKRKKPLEITNIKYFIHGFPLEVILQGDVL
jgi:hypothetical protein